MADLASERPLWLRIANFQQRSLSLLRLLPRGQMVLWKLEHWGTETRFERIPASPGINLTAYADLLLGMGHRVFPYTFTERNRDLLHREVPSLRRTKMAILPIAQKTPAAEATGDTVRSCLGLSDEDTLLDAGGLLHPAKGIDELVDWFARTNRDPRMHLLCSLIPDDGQTEADIRRRWTKSTGLAAHPRVHVRLSDYSQWEWMCSFYRAVDVMLVNSVSDSWGRMVSEALGLGVPTIVRRADCGTNHIASEVVRVDGFADLGSGEFTRAVGEARGRVPRLADYVNSHYGIPVVRRHLLELLRSHTPADRLDEFDRLSIRPRSVALVDAVLDH
ncbi:MAG: hypothetical protein ACRDQ5_19775 [Sciscionella sp.]